MKAIVIGLGRMGRFHVRALRDLGLDVVTVDPDPAAGADYARAPFGSFDVACIATPIEHLAEQAEAWAPRVERLLVEKPFAASVKDARELEQRIDSWDGRIAVGYVERFNPTVRDLVCRLDGHEIVGVEFVRHNTRPAAGPFDLVTHDLDLANHLGLSDLVRCEFDARGGMPETIRQISVHCRDSDGFDRVVVADLTAHDSSPLHALWHAFLVGAGDYATPRDAVGVLVAAERRWPRAVAA